MPGRFVDKTNKKKMKSFFKENIAWTMTNYVCATQLLLNIAFYVSLF